MLLEEYVFGKKRFCFNDLGTNKEEEKFLKLQWPLEPPPVTNKAWQAELEWNRVCSLCSWWLSKNLSPLLWRISFEQSFLETFFSRDV